ncbi:hypothetical protein N7510_007369 [Penicillium lagena]|uniref:uncharacterized protein n=1 Tax=Penicillium lagena TaxID=94218 RepID=UPI0025407B12|nr:uncharacterized protein N7510_007369 [Penicillium lagena]KAJ5610650.1 hypothetical protein N7510_007369 [Penicillium lagena]
MSGKQGHTGPCVAHKNTNRIYLGPGEGTAMRDAIDAAHKRVHGLLPPDLVIRHRWSDNFEVHAHMLCYQSLYLFRRCKPRLESDPMIANTGLLPALNIPDPVHPKDGNRGKQWIE